MLMRRVASEAVAEHGWRFLAGTLRTAVAVGSAAQAAEVVTLAVDAGDHLRADVRADRVSLTLQDPALAWVTTRDVELAHRITAAVRALGLETSPRGVQVVEIGIDALDIAAVRPFWRAVLGYGGDGARAPLADPAGCGPTVWFQQMTEPRPQRNRVHFDVAVPHDEAAGRIEAALGAGGRLVSDAWAPSFWVLADPEGNEACVTTWQGRDPE